MEHHSSVKTEGSWLVELSDLSALHVRQGLLGPDSVQLGTRIHYKPGSSPVLSSCIAKDSGSSSIELRKKIVSAMKLATQIVHYKSPELILQDMQKRKAELTKRS
jgi:hypothetical protein